MIEYQLMTLFQNLIVLNHESHTRYFQPTNPTGLTDTQLIVLEYLLVESKGHDVFAKELESFFGIKASSVNSIVNYLEEAEYIRREAVKEDRRLKRLTPTELALASEEWLLETMHDSIVDVFAGFTEEELRSLKTLMEKMGRNLDSMAKTGRPCCERDPLKAYRHVKK